MPFSVLYKTWRGLLDIFIIKYFYTEVAQANFSGTVRPPVCSPCIFSFSLFSWSRLSGLSKSQLLRDISPRVSCISVDLTSRGTAFCSWLCLQGSLYSKQLWKTVSPSGAKCKFAHNLGRQGWCLLLEQRVACLLSSLIKIISPSETKDRNAHCPL